MIKILTKITLILTLTISNLINASFPYTPFVSANNNILSYIEDPSNTANPERGFFRNYYGSPNPTELAGYSANKTTMYRPVYDISPFISSPFSGSFLNQLEADAAGFRQAGVKIMPNFQYSNGGASPNDATKSVILGHLEQLRSYFYNNSDVIALLPIGFVGDYGEFTISSNENITYTENKPYVASGSPTLDDLSKGTGGFIVNQNTREIVSKILNVLPVDRAFLTRQPATKKQLVNSIYPISNQEAFNQSNKSRLGHENDSLVGNPYEGATFVYSPTNDPYGRSLEEDYYNQDGNYVPHIGETEYFDDGVTGQCSNTLPKLRSRHLSSINETYNLNTLNLWKSQGCFNEIAKKQGYRFVLNNTELTPNVGRDKDFNLKINLSNTGYATPFNARNFEVILRNKTTGTNYPISVTDQSDPRFWSPNYASLDINLNVKASVPEGSYDVLLNLPDPYLSLSSNPAYSIQFSNQNTWESKTGYNKLNQTLNVGPQKTESAKLPTGAPAKKEYFVSKSGLDTNNGSQSSPFNTVEYCKKIIQDGDICNSLDIQTQSSDNSISSSSNNSNSSQASSSSNSQESQNPQSQNKSAASPNVRILTQSVSNNTSSGNWMVDLKNYVLAQNPIEVFKNVASKIVVAAIPILNVNLAIQSVNSYLNIPVGIDQDSKQDITNKY